MSLPVTSVQGEKTHSFSYIKQMFGLCSSRGENFILFILSLCLGLYTCKKKYRAELRTEWGT